MAAKTKMKNTKIRKTGEFLHEENYPDFVEEEYPNMPKGKRTSSARKSAAKRVAKNRKYSAESKLKSPETETPKTESKSVKPPKSAVGKKEVAAKRANTSKQAARRVSQEVDLRSKMTEAGKKIPKGKTARGMHAEEMLAKHFGKGGKAGVKGALGKAGAVAAAGLAGYAAGTALYKYGIKPVMDKSFEEKTKLKTAELKKQAEKEIADVRAKRLEERLKKEGGSKSIIPSAEKKIGEDVKQNGVTKSAVTQKNEPSKVSTPEKSKTATEKKSGSAKWTPELNKLVKEREKAKKEGKSDYAKHIQNKINEAMGSKVRHKVSGTDRPAKAETYTDTHTGAKTEIISRSNIKPPKTAKTEMPKSAVRARMERAQKQATTEKPVAKKEESNYKGRITVGRRKRK